MEIFLAKTAGFCFGVRRALDMVLEALKKNDSLYSLGPLIHNPGVVQKLSEQGIQVIDDVDDISTGKLIIRSHGVGPNIYKRAQDKKIDIIDATCPFVKNVQKLGTLLSKQGYQVIIFGERNHAEVKGVLESIDNEAMVITKIEELDIKKLSTKVGLISQTTQENTEFGKIAAAIIPLTKEIRVFNTICSATSKRQEETADLSRQVDVMIVVGGKNSANTFRLVEICKNIGTTTYHVESASEIKNNWFLGVGKVGITAGASTPDDQIHAVVEKIKSIGG